MDAAWQYGRACYEAARCATNRTEKARVAQQGIDVCRRLIARQPASAAGHYYLSLNIGEVADTRRNFAALGMVRDMEKEFKKAIELEERFDYAGPDRALGLLYQEAPVFGSIGSRSKARQHFKRALELSPEFPENRLVFIEANLKWGDASAARREIADLEQDWEPARSRFSGARWEPAWEEWDARLAAAKKKAGAVASRPVAEAPRNK